jgi:hypothetical protein
MADSPEVVLRFAGSCPDCGVREVHLPGALPPVADDLDWLVRDYDGFRLFMLEELAARFPERRRWTPADLEVVLVEALAALLDQLSDMADRVAAEGFLESARRPDSVRRLLELIGYDAVGAAQARSDAPDNLLQAQGEAAEQALEAFWRDNPHAMSQAKLAGPRQIHDQKRMVTVSDYAVRLREHPLVLQAHAWKEWSGSWYTVRVALIGAGNAMSAAIGSGEVTLDSRDGFSEEQVASVDSFHRRIGLPVPNLDSTPPPSVRMVLRPYLDSFRMVGQEVILQDPVYVGIHLSLSVRLADNFYQSEMRHAIAQALGSGPSGFFEPGRHGFGEDLYASDLIEALMQLDGIRHVCLNRFKRVGSQHPDRADAGFIMLDGLEVAVCGNQASAPELGYYRLKLHGGRKG